MCNKIKRVGDESWESREILSTTENCARAWDSGHDTYPELSAYFYSNLSVQDPTHIQFIVCEKVFDVHIDLLADILGVERSGFMSIKASNDEVI